MLSAISFAAGSHAASPPVYSLTMDDLPPQSVDGLVHPAGVTFGYTVDGASSADARYNSGGPGSLVYVQDPSIEGGTAGILTLEFAQPTPLLEFGVAVSIAQAVLNDAILVELRNHEGSVVSLSSMTLNSVENFSEGQFSYSGAAVKSATIDFTPTHAMFPSARFAFDNLAFSVVVPEPLTAVVLAWGVGVGVCIRRRGRSC